MASKRNSIFHALLRGTAAGALKTLQAAPLSFWSRKPLALQPVFIVGTPRSGSTFLYQLLTNQFNVAYIDNLAAKLADVLPMAMWVSHVCFRSKPHNSFTSDVGRTKGLHSPSECGAFWYRWLPRDEHYVATSAVDPRVASQISAEVRAISNSLRRPMVFKNLNAGQRLALIRICFPEARIIHIRRSTDATVASILRARHAAGVKEGEWWSVMPQGYRDLLGLPEEQMVQAQVELLERQIAADRILFPPGQWQEVVFENISLKVVEDLGAWLGLTRRPGAILPEEFSCTRGEFPLERAE